MYRLDESKTPRVIYQDELIFMEIIASKKRAQLEAALPIIESSVLEYLPISVEMKEIKVVGAGSPADDDSILMVVMNEIDCDDAEQYALMLQFLAVGVLNGMEKR